MGKEISYGLVIEMNEPTVNNEALTVPDTCCLEGHFKVSSYKHLSFFSMWLWELDSGLCALKADTRDIYLQVIFLLNYIILICIQHIHIHGILNWHIEIAYIYRSRIRFLICLYKEKSSKQGSWQLRLRPIHHFSVFTPLENSISFFGLGSKLLSTKMFKCTHVYFFFFNL